MAQRKNKEYVSATKAAQLTDVTKQAVYLAIREKKLKAYKVNKRLRIYLDDLEEYKKRKFSRIHHGRYKGKPVFDEDVGYFSVDKASELIEVNKQKLYYAIRTGTLRATRKGAAWVIYGLDLIKYKNQLKTNFTLNQA